MWPRRSHTLAPLTKLTSINKNVRWTKFKQDSFDKIKRILAHDSLLTHPYFNKTFKIYTDASAFQLGAFISQEGKHISFYSVKLTDSQQRYTVTGR